MGYAPPPQAAGTEQLPLKSITGGGYSMTDNGAFAPSAPSVNSETARSRAQASRVSFLLAGMARSGTTVAQRLLTEIDNVRVSPETHFWRHAASMDVEFPFPHVSKQAQTALQWFGSMDSSRFLDFDAAEVVSRLGEASYAWDLFVALVETLVGASGDDLIIGEKTPDHLRWAEQLLEAVDDLRLIGLVRDPREVYRSHLSVPWGITDPVAFGEKWLELSRRVRDVQRITADRVLAVRYEDMVADPDAFKSTAAEFVGAPLKDTGQRLVALFAPEEWWKADALERIESRSDRWTDELPPESVTDIERLCGVEMEGWGYKPLASTQMPSQTSFSSLRDDVRKAGNRAAATHLSVSEQWMDPTIVRSYATSARAAVALRDATRRQAELEHKVRDLEHQVVEVSEAAERNAVARDSWRERAEFHQDEEKRIRALLESEKVQGLRAERRRVLAEGRLRRIRERRWWRLGEALGRWRRRPHRLDDLLRAIKVLLTSKPLPPLPDLSSIDRRLEELGAPVTQANPSGAWLQDVREWLAAGEYETALEALDRLPAEIREGREACLLARTCHSRMGDLTDALREVNRALIAKADPDLEAQARRLEGRLREMDAAWLPQIAGPPRAPQAAEPGRILHIVKESLPYFERGYTIRSHSTFLAQREAGFEPIAVTSLGFPRHQGFTDFPLVERIDDVEHHRLDLGPDYDLRRVPLDLQLDDHATLLARLADDLRPEVIQAGSGYRGYETALVGRAVAARHDIPFIYEFRSHLEQTWTGEIERSEHGEQYHGRSRQELRCLLEADGVITIANAMREELIRLGVPGSKIDVVPNAVDVERFSPRSPDLGLQERYGLKGHKVVGYISNLGQREGIGHLVRAIAHLRDAGEGVKGLVVGDGPERERLEELITSLELQGRFVLTGHVPNEQIEEHYALFDVFVVPRIDDKAARLVTPLKPLEAMAMARPLVAADLPALREIIEPGVSGELFPPGDSVALASLLSDLLADDARCTALASAGREWVTAERTIEANARRYRRVLDTMRGV